MASSSREHTQKRGTRAQDTTRLHGAEADAYLERVMSLLQSARLNDHYTHVRGLLTHLEAMHSHRHRGLYPTLEVGLASGLPTYKEWSRVKTDAAVAASVLADMPGLETLEAKARRAPHSIHGKQLLKYHYYQFLSSREIAPLEQMHVALRNVDESERTAAFHIVFDKLDARGLIIRYSIDLQQHSTTWGRDLVSLDFFDQAKHTEVLRGVIYRFTSLDAEFTFVNLCAKGPLTAERVFKATIGPFFLDELGGSTQIPGIFPCAGAAVGMFALDSASCDIADDGDNDPIEDLMIDSLSPEARISYEEARKKYGYKVYKDRKFVADRRSMPALREFCRADGTRNIIYPQRPLRKGWKKNVSTKA